MEIARARGRLPRPLTAAPRRPRENPEAVAEMISPQARGDELQELAETFRRTVDRLASLVGELEEAHRQALQAEVDKKQFYRQVIRAVTQGRFELVEPAELPEVGERVADLPVQDGRGYLEARRAILEAAGAAGMSEERADDLLLAAGEAITNALKHATEGRCCIYRTHDGIIVRITDRGAGIHAHDLPNVILTPGFSTKVSLGMGYTMMLRLADRVWLSTDCEGTTVQLEKKIAAPPEPPSPLAAAIERL